MPMRPPAGFISAFYDPLKNPNAPTIGTATAGDASASVAFTAPSNVGGSAISSYSALSTPGGLVGTAASSPVTVSGLTNGSSYTFIVWAINTYGPSAFSASSNSVTPEAAVPGIGFFGGNGSNTVTNVISQVTIGTLGNATDFGDLSVTRYALGACSSSTRGIFAGGLNPAGDTNLNTIDYITFSTVGNATDFGDLTQTKSEIAGCSSSTRGLFVGGQRGTGGTNTPINVIEYITIASTGNGTDFGDIAVITRAMEACASSTRGIFSNGSEDTYSANTNTIQYVTIASTGNATDFGDTTAAWTSGASCSNSTRGVMSSGVGNGDVFLNIINYITIASTGNATDFGDLIFRIASPAACANTTRGIWGGGSFYNSGTGSTTYYNVIQYVTIATTGDATDFGDLTAVSSQFAACSNAHGGL
jgi:hypothetical protein